jgi:hypothetical protein
VLSKSAAGALALDTMGDCATAAANTRLVEGSGGGTAADEKRPPEGRVRKRGVRVIEEVHGFSIEKCEYQI